MGSINTTNSTSIPPLLQRVYIDGKRRSDIQCLSISQSFNGQGTTANLDCPSWCYDRDKSFLRGAFILIQVKYSGSYFWDTVFCGYITNVNSSPSTRVSLTASSLIALSDYVYIGQADIDDNSLYVYYPEYAYENGVYKETGWNIKTCLRDVFNSSLRTWKGGGGSIPSQYRSKLQLGSLSVLNSKWNNVKIASEYKNTTLRSFLDDILRASGYIRFSEEFRSSGDTVLKFFELASYTNNTKTMKIASRGECIRGSNIQDLEYSESLDGVINRCTVLGDYQRYMISLTLGNGGLIKGWNTALESSVLSDPESAQGGQEVTGSTSKEKQRVFREYDLNPIFKKYNIDKENFLDVTSGKLPIQVLKYGIASYSHDTTTGTTTMTISSTPNELITGFELDVDSLKLKLNEPAINHKSRSLVSGVVTDVYEEALIALTITIRGKQLIYDTGTKSSPYNLTGISSDGLNEVIGPLPFRYEQYTNKGFPIDGVEYNCVYYTSTTGFVTKTSQDVYIDQTKDLENAGNIFLFEKSQIKTTYDITIPYYTKSYEVGDRLIIQGPRDFNYYPHVINNISWDLTEEHKTYIRTDSNEPEVASTFVQSV